MSIDDYCANFLHIKNVIDSTLGFSSPPFRNRSKSFLSFYTRKRLENYDKSLGANIFFKSLNKNTRLLISVIGKLQSGISWLNMQFSFTHWFSLLHGSHKIRHFLVKCHRSAHHTRVSGRMSCKWWKLAPSKKRKKNTNKQRQKTTSNVIFCDTLRVTCNMSMTSLV